LISDRRKQKWIGKRVVVLGFARQGKAVARYCAQRGAEVIVSDMRPAEEFVDLKRELEALPIEYVFGGHPEELVEGADLMCLSGGVPANAPLAKLALERGVQLSNDAQLTLEACPAPVIGITGSAGKSTTTALVGEMARAQARDSGWQVWVGGNIGRPLLEDLDEINSEDMVVMELSSFQLELMTVSPRVAVLLNITPNHLDRHRTMQAYSAAKERILSFQSTEDTAVLGRDDPVAWGLRKSVRGKLLSFGFDPADGLQGTYFQKGAVWLRDEDGDQELFKEAAIQLQGHHNLFNVLAASAIASATGISRDAIEEGVRTFKGLPHRLEFVRTVNGADWVNDSIATAPERSIASMRAFEQPIVLLAGGRDKDLAWDTFADEVYARVDHLILFGEAAAKIASSIEPRKQGELPRSIEIVDGLEQAVQAAARVARPGDVVLLAPGGTSFDEFIDFEARGERFRELVQAL
jgi:UDP-N-acetylmuramoylalanine--D-glutamate ligase